MAPCHFLSGSPSSGEEFLEGNHALLCSENPVGRALPQLGAGDSRWMRSERPMVWCCFFVHAQVSSFAAGPGRDPLPTPTQAWLGHARSWGMGGCSCLHLPRKWAGSHQEHLGWGRHTSASLYYESEKSCVVVFKTTNGCAWWRWCVKWSA